MQEVDSHRIQQHEFIGTTEQRVERLIYYAMRQGEGHTALQNRQNALSNRIEKLEALAQERAIIEARENARDERVLERIDALATEVNKLKAIGAKAIWIFVGALCLAFARWVLAGGLNAVQ